MTKSCNDSLAQLIRYDALAHLWNSMAPVSSFEELSNTLLKHAKFVIDFNQLTILFLDNIHPVRIDIHTGSTSILYDHNCIFDEMEINLIEMAAQSPKALADKVSMLREACQNENNNFFNAVPLYNEQLLQSLMILYSAKENVSPIEKKFTSALLSSVTQKIRHIISLQQLEVTQQQIVEASKIKMISRMVKGISHELNTPLGVISTATSYIPSIIDTINKEITSDSQSFESSVFEDLFDQIRNTVNIIESNANRLIKLSNDFKQIVSFETDIKPHEFAISQLIQSVVALWNDELVKKKLA